MKYEPGIGATRELSLRVSAATLVRVLLENSPGGDLMLALERRATLYRAENGRVVEVKSQPFGGAIRILDLMKLRDLIGNFHFDSERSRSEQDFRILIRPSDWETVREFCVEHFSRVEDPVLETDPGREMTEEFADALKASLGPDQYSHRPIATVVEDDPAPTENIHAKGIPTARIYRIFEATISDPFLAQAMMENSASISDQDLCEFALEDGRHGGKGQASAILILPMKRITDHYLALQSKERNIPILFDGHRLDETVPAIIKGIAVPKYRRL